MNRPEECAKSTVAPPCTPAAEPPADHDLACFSMSPDDSSGSVADPGADCIDLRDRSDPAETIARQQVRPEVAPKTGASGATPATVDDAIKLAIKLAVDAGEYECAAALLDVATRKAPPTSVTQLGSANWGLRKH